jgi:alanine racemase
LNDPVTWAEIDLAAYAHNLTELNKLCGPETQLMAVVKADAYGHGADRIARRAVETGVHWFGVARLEEGVGLREAGIEVPILVLGYSPPTATQILLEQNLTQAIVSYSAAKDLSAQAVTANRRIRAHLKIDTGMGRIGLVAHPGDPTTPDGLPVHGTIREALEIARLPGLELEGVFTHLASADSPDKSEAKHQIDRFLTYLDRLEKEGLTFRVRHAANSAAMIALPDSHLDVVRPGIATYGLTPSPAMEPGEIDLRPVLQWKSRIVQLKNVPAGFGVSYGTTYRTSHPTVLATVPVGYADGLSWQLSSRGQMLVGGVRVPIVGRVCMDMIVLDVGRVSDVGVGDEVVLIGHQGQAFVSVEEMASTRGTISYEVVTTITPRIPRIYSG